MVHIDPIFTENELKKVEGNEEVCLMFKHVRAIALCKQFWVTIYVTRADHESSCNPTPPTHPQELWGLARVFK